MRSRMKNNTIFLKKIKSNKKSLVDIKLINIYFEFINNFIIEIMNAIFDIYFMRSINFNFININYY